MIAFSIKTNLMNKASIQVNEHIMYHYEYAVSFDILNVNHGVHQEN